MKGQYTQTPHLPTPGKEYRQQKQTKQGAGMKQFSVSPAFTAGPEMHPEQQPGNSRAQYRTTPGGTQNGQTIVDGNTGARAVRAAHEGSDAAVDMGGKGAAANLRKGTPTPIDRRAMADALRHKKQIGHGEEKDGY